VFTLIADRFAIVLETAGACGDTFARHPARIAILVLLSMEPMDPTAASPIGTRIRPRYGDPSLRGAAEAPRGARLTGPGFFSGSALVSRRLRRGYGQHSVQVHKRGKRLARAQNSTPELI
jgi:hypothetical protein